MIIIANQVETHKALSLVQIEDNRKLNPFKSVEDTSRVRQGL